MLKPVLAGIAALSVAGAGLALAQQQEQQSPQTRAERQQTRAERWRPSAEDTAALLDARIAALRAGLKLSAEQEKHWPAVETAIRELAKQRADRREARRAARSADTPRPDAIERWRRGADAMATRGAALKQLADAAEPLYQSLDEGQKRRFAMLMRMGRHGGAMHRHHRRG